MPKKHCISPSPFFPRNCNLLAALCQTTIIRNPPPCLHMQQGGYKKPKFYFLITHQPTTAHQEELLNSTNHSPSRRAKKQSLPFSACKDLLQTTQPDHDCQSECENNSTYSVGACIYTLPYHLSGILLHNNCTLNTAAFLPPLLAGFTLPVRAPARISGGPAAAHSDRRMQPRRGEPYLHLLTKHHPLPPTTRKPNTTSWRQCFFPASLCI